MSQRSLSYTGEFICDHRFLISHCFVSRVVGVSDAFLGGFWAVLGLIRSYLLYVGLQGLGCHSLGSSALCRREGALGRGGLEGEWGRKERQGKGQRLVFMSVQFDLLRISAPLKQLWLLSPPTSSSLSCSSPLSLLSTCMWVESGSMRLKSKGYSSKPQHKPFALSSFFFFFC